MRRIVALLVAMVLAALCGCSSSKTEENSSGEDYAVVFKDAAIEYAVRQQLGKPSGSVMASSLTGLKIMSITPKAIQFNNDAVVPMPNGTSIQSLDDLEHMKKLGSLMMGELAVKDFSVISSLTVLQRLIIYQSPELTDLEPIKNLPRLVSLSLYRNPRLKDFSAIASAEGLVELDLHQCGLTDISMLEGLEKINKLSLFGNKIQDISPLAGLTRMLELDLHSNNITDIAPLSDMERLTRLYLDSNNISDISALDGKPNLTTLKLNNNKISDLSPLEDLEKLRSLSLGSNLVDAAAVSALRAKLPEDCKIEWN